jgi:hypothetical protein
MTFVWAMDAPTPRIVETSCAFEASPKARVCKRNRHAAVHAKTVCVELLLALFLAIVKPIKRTPPAINNCLAES